MILMSGLAGLGASGGAILRYLVMQFEKQFNHQVPFPWATFGINLVGSLCLGVLMGSTWPLAIKVFLGAGLLGGFTTFSTMVNEVVLLMHDHHHALAVGYVVASLLGGVALAAVGYL
ncbi:fluoride efflux transporter FluC [Furfurilactobacillus entadae]|uniref:fluoride efflux transporter FluC n=1 Tax=Furfurilactobacillus entadae TaxID=2922307 RepID=UPI0035E5DD4F